MINNLHSIWTTTCQATGDIVLGWLLYFQRDLTLFGLAVLTAGLLLIVRRWASDQQALACMQQDNRRLVKRIRDARRSGERDSLLRYRKTRARVARMRMLAEVRLGLLSFVPLAALVSWGNARLPNLPCVAGESFDFVVYTPASAAGDVIHLVPSSDVEPAGGWVREVEIGQQDGRPRGFASWSLQASHTRADSQLTVRLKSRTIVHPLLIGQPRYAPPVISHDGEIQSVVRLQVFKPLGCLPGLMGLTPWLVGYLAQVVALFYGTKYLIGLC